MKKKLKVAVLYGGPSAEREISLVTGKAIFDNLDREKYVPTLVEMTKDSRFVIKAKGKKRVLDIQNKDRKLFDLYFVALHGTFGEDGAVQGMLESLGIRYTGSRVLASALAMDKVRAGDMYRAYGLPTPPFIPFGRSEWKSGSEEIIKEINTEIKYPVVIKPSDQGSAVGVSIVKNKAELRSVIEKTLKMFPNLMAQKFIKGKEGTCGVLEIKRELHALPPTHIIANFDEFYDYKSKYKPGGSTHVCPADFPPEVNEKMQELAVAAHQVLGCRGMSRTDIFYADDGALWIIETNTIPGMTPMSLLPEAAEKAGISFSKMLDFIIEASL